MDVILDTNIYVSLLRSIGSGLFESGPFPSLLAYLRRTGDSLVIPDVVYEEFRHEYQDRVQLSFKKAQDAWDSYVRDLTSPKHFPEKLNVLKEWQGIEADFLKPDKNVKVIHYKDYSSVSIQEVVKRGVYRIPPANSNGEELRDVVIWLMTLEYARGKTVAFICADGHFHAGKDLHPNLQKDLSSYGADIKFFRDLGDFLRKTSLAESKVSTETYQKLTSGYDLVASITEYLVGKTLERNTITAATVGEVALHEGTQYEISSDSAYIELTVKGVANFQLQAAPYVSISTFLTPQTNQGWNFNPSAFYGEVPPSFFGLAGVTPLEFSNFKTFNPAPTTLIKTLTTEVEFLAHYRIRAVNNQPKSIEIDHVLITSSIELREIAPQTPEAPAGSSYPQP